MLKTIKSSRTYKICTESKTKRSFESVLNNPVQMDRVIAANVVYYNEAHKKSETGATKIVSKR